MQPKPIMPRDHRTSKEEFPLAEAQRLRAAGQSYKAIAATIGWSFAQVYRKLNAEPSIVDTAAETADVPPTVNGQSAPAMQKIAIANIILDGGTQMRESLNLATIAEYTDAMAEGSKFPPVVVFSDGESFWLGDGFQRVKAAEQVGYVEIAADIRSGTLRDAILFACGANATHGERRTNRDKRKSVLTLLNDPEWSHWSDRRIADVCGVSHPFVAEVRQSLVTVTSENQHDDTSTRQYVTKHGTTTTMDTSNIGKRATGEHKRTEAPEPSPAPQPVLIEFDEPPFAGNGIPTTTPADLQAETTLTMPSRCATCAEVVTLIDDALTQLNTSGYLDCEQILLTVRRLVTEKTAAHDA